jgi:S1-C subfamily serine protease
VAGARQVTVSTASGPALPARVIVYDPHRDVAVLWVAALDLPPLETALARVGQRIVVLGYSEQGPLSAVDATVSRQFTTSGPNIYGTGAVTHVVLLLSTRAPVDAKGLSGGPLISADNRVVGMTFAVNDRNPAHELYAATAADISTVLARAPSPWAMPPTSTRGCV